MPTTLHPGERLHEWLQMGLCDPDQEGDNRAHNFMEWADSHPIEALRWLPKLRRTKRNPTTERRWEYIREIVEGPRQATALAAPAVSVPSIQHEAPHFRILPSNPVGLPQEYENWKTKNISASALAEIKAFAPTRVKEALALESRAKQTADSSIVRALLKRAVGIWAALLNIKEPVLCQLL